MILFNSITDGSCTAVKSEREGRYSHLHSAFYSECT